MTKTKPIPSTAQMTIEKYYITFGFKVKLTSVMRKEGYTVETLTPELRAHYSSDFDQPTDEKILLAWFKEDFLDQQFAPSYEFEIDGAKFVIRTFTHNKKGYNEYVIVGVDLGTIENFEGVLATTGNVGIQGMKTLVTDLGWSQMIKECGDVDACRYDLVDYCVKDPKFETFSIAPQTFITTDDCPCCS